MVRQRILARYPDDSLVGEEEASRHGTSGVTWVIDPLDGTTNFVHRIPAFAVSIGVMDGDEVVAGVVHAPVLKETYAAFVGGGSVLNRKPIRVSGVERIPQALVASGFADVRAGMQPNNLSAFSHFVSKAQAVRRMGAASVDLAYVASGRFDAFWEYGLGPWDVCAGTLLITEAGGRVSDADGGGMHLSGKSVVATNGAIHQEVLESLNAFPRPDRGAA